MLQTWTPRTSQICQLARKTSAIKFPGKPDLPCGRWIVWTFHIWVPWIKKNKFQLFRVHSASSSPQNGPGKQIHTVPGNFSGYIVSQIESDSTTIPGVRAHLWLSIWPPGLHCKCTHTFTTGNGGNSVPLQLLSEAKDYYPKITLQALFEMETTFKGDFSTSTDEKRIHVNTART